MPTVTCNGNSMQKFLIYYQFIKHTVVVCHHHSGVMFFTVGWWCDHVWHLVCNTYIHWSVLRLDCCVRCISYIYHSVCWSWLLLSHTHSHLANAKNFSYADSGNDGIDLHVLCIVLLYVCSVCVCVCASLFCVCTYIHSPSCRVTLVYH